MTENWNIASLLPKVAARLKDHVAVIVPLRRGADGRMEYKSWTFAQLDSECDKYAHGLAAMGIGKGTRTLLMVRPGFDFLALTFAIFKVGAAPVLIDPGMGKNNLLDCVKNARPEAFVAIPLAHMARKIYPKSFRSVKQLVTVGRRWLWGGETLESLRAMGEGKGAFPPVDVAASDMAAILFTTGSTGIPKGVVYDHGIFTSQARMIGERYEITEKDRDLPAFPLFALFSVSLGMSVVIPRLDPTNPGKADPAQIVEEINDNQVTFSFGSPAIWKNVSRYCVQNKIKLPSLKRVLMAGAPVANNIHNALLNHILPEDGKTHTPFGATESLPVCDIEGAEVLAETAALSAQGKGTCVGRPLPGMSVKIIRITEAAVEEWDDSLALPQGKIGEIVVSGPVVTKEYFELPDQTHLAKIRDPKTGDIMHRMGDVGYLDERGRLWFCGRKAHRVVTPESVMFTIPCEAVFNQHSAVVRSALVGLGPRPVQRPVIIVELDKVRPVADEARITAELLKLASQNRLTQHITDVLFHPEFPTDIRHNAKIFREKLKVWAEGQLPHLIPKEMP
ncbi:MAG: fatty acid CoA ligase family protein [Nitrospinota bacterium]|nr:fatty acid CoA ligase family protein [Nitrospinota bacterium]